MLHNRKDFRSRLYGSTVRALAKNGSTLTAVTVRTSREAYVWSLRPPILEVHALEVRASKPSGCLHFLELEAYGVPMRQRDSSFREVPEAAPTHGRRSTGASLGSSTTRQPGSSSQPQLQQQPRQQQPKQPQQQTQSREVPQTRVSGATSQGGLPAMSDEPHKYPLGDPRNPPASQGKSQNPAADAPTPRPGQPPASGNADERIADERAWMAANEEDEAFWSAATGTLTAALMLFFQYLWVKSRWTDIWH